MSKMKKRISVMATWLAWMVAGSARAASCAEAPDRTSPVDSVKLRADLASVLSQASPDEYIPITIVMKDRVPRDEIDALARIPDKTARRRAVIDRLKSTASASQAPILAVLTEGQDTCEVSRDYLQGLWIANVVGVKVTKATVYRIAARDDVDYVNYDRPVDEQVLPVEPRDYGDESDPAESVECGVELMNAPQVWNELGITGRGVVVAMIDTGCCLTHPDLANHIWTNPGEIPDNNIDDDNNGFVDDVHGWSFDHNVPNPDIQDYHGHGTHTSGTVAGDGTGGVATGMAPGARIMVTKFWDDVTAELAVWWCEQYAVENGADITSGSLGWRHDLNPDRRTWREVCENTIAAGLVVVYAAGNEGCANPPDAIRTPGDVPDVVTVGAIHCNDERAPFTSCGPVEWEFIDPYNDCAFPPGCIKPSVTAPGMNTTSCRLDPCYGYAILSGTSMSTPHVTGAVALMLEANPALDHRQIKSLLESTAVDLGPPGSDDTFGYGRVDAYQAVVQAAGENSAPGACCLGDGLCVDMSLADCRDSGGTWQFATDCASYVCPQPGACCIDGSCETLTPRACDAAQGEFQGMGTSCRHACACDKIRKFKGTCKDTGDVKAIVKFLDDSMNGNTLAIRIDDRAFSATVSQRKAIVFAGPYAAGDHTIALADPDCGREAVVGCP